MHIRNTLITLLIMFITACQYHAPLTTEHNIPIDPAILGAWESVPGTGEWSSSIEKMRVQKFSSTEYMIHYFTEGSEMDFRAYLIEVAGISAIQLELIGTDEGAIGEDDKDPRFIVASYAIKDGGMEIRLLNTKLISDALKDSKSIHKAFIEHRENPELFVDPGMFKRT